MPSARYAAAVVSIGEKLFVVGGMEENTKILRHEDGREKNTKREKDKKIFGKQRID